MLKKRMKFILSGLVIILAAACTAAPGGGGGNNPGGGSSSSGGLVLGPGVYVATNGNDINSGITGTAPVKTIQTALDKAAVLGLTNIYVAAGVYKPGSGLSPVSNGIQISNDNISLLGGFSADFISRPGKSELDGTNGLFHIIYINGARNNLIDGFIVENGNAAGSGIEGEGGGLFLNGALSCRITNTVISNNTAMNYGGGISLNNSINNIITAVISFNTVSSHGAGILDIAGISNTINSFIVNNTAGSLGGGIFLQDSSYSIISGTIQSNHADAAQGGGIYCNGSPSIKNILITNARIMDNTAVHGGGISIGNVWNVRMVNVTLKGNSAGSLGGGLNLTDVSNFSFSGEISDNSAAHGGGINIYGGSNLIFNIIISNNSCSFGGGGIDAEYVNGLSMQGSLNGNTAGGGGGGMYLLYCVNCGITADISGNNANAGGGIYFERTTNTQLLNSIITNNSGSVITLLLTGNAVISNCMIGNTNHSIEYGIIESGGDTTNQVLVNNTFLTNTLLYLYYDGKYGDIALNEVYKLNSTNINSTNYTGASAAAGNTVQ